MAFRVDQIDHVELTVPSRSEAAEWYFHVLGLQRNPSYESWSENPKGPLMLETPAGNTKIALFRGNSSGSKPGTGFHLLAFRTTAINFLHFLDLLDSLDLKDRNGNLVESKSVTDHQLAFSIYFCDPWQNEIEITTYEHETVRASLSAPSS